MTRAKPSKKMKDQVIYSIFDKAIQVFYDDSVQSNILRQELEIYPILDPETNIKFRVHINTIPNEGWIASNPKNYFYFPDGYLSIATTNSKRIKFNNDKTIDCYFKMNGHKSWLRRAIQKTLNKQFHHREESIGQGFHEIVLMGLLVFMEQCFPIHASGFISPAGKSFLIGGTGGVGKTSSEIELCFNRSYTFLADDIAVVDKDGWCYPNLSFPKIYAYNLEGKGDFKNQVLANRGFLEKIHWIVWRSIGLDKVRKRLAPNVIFENHATSKTRLDSYFLLAKSGNSEFKAVDVTTEQAVEMTIKILKNELHTLFQEIRLLELNSNYMKQEQFWSEEKIVDQWRASMTQAFADVNLKVIQIPKVVNHDDLKSSIANYIEKGAFI